MSNLFPKLQFILVPKFNRFPTLMPPLLPKSIAATLLLFSLMGCDALFKNVPNSGNQLNSNYFVKRIADGDTITITDSSGKDLKVRFACIDAPEIAHTIKKRIVKKRLIKTNLSGENKQSNACRN